MTHFFSVYKSLEGKDTKVENIRNRAAAIEVISAAMENYKKCFCGG
jgi:inorganic pyrophosphatase